jgi:hypothetical protein
MTRHQKRATAIHEAGHAVIGRVLGLVCGPVTVTADHESAGHSIIADPWDTISAWNDALQAQVECGACPVKYYNPRAAFRGTIVARMAGAEAEVILLGRCQGGDGRDRREIELLAASSDSECSGDEWDRYEPRMRRQARRLIRKHRATIERVAAELLKRRTLTKDEADALVPRR